MYERERTVLQGWVGLPPLSGEPDLCKALLHGGAVHVPQRQRR